MIPWLLAVRQGYLRDKYKDNHYLSLLQYFFTEKKKKKKQSRY